jgi:thiol-disulfide isomerase/thioredoxin
LIACITASGLAENLPPHREWPSGAGDFGGMGSVMMVASSARKGLAWIGAAAALYGIAGCGSNPPGGGSDLHGLAHGDMAKLAVESAPYPEPTATFFDAAGKPHTLAEFKGKVVVLNAWATWCAPCVQEMSTLAKLQTAMQGQPVVVIPISVDTKDDEANAEAFLAKRPPLPFYSDPNYAVAYALKPPADGLPTTVLIDPAGNVRARLSGGADWSGADAAAVIQALEKPG